MSKRRKEQKHVEWDDAELYTDESEPLRLQEVLEPYGAEPAPYNEDYAEPDYADEALEYDEDGKPIYQDMYLGYDEYSEYDDEHEGNPEGRFKVAMSVFNVISVLVGILAILVLVALLVSLINWLGADIRHSFVLLQSNLQ